MISSAYIHIPFCSYKCDFCDFAAYANLEHLAEQYIEIVCREIEDRLASQTAKPVISSVFYGGGTPGLLAVELIEKLQQTLANKVLLAPDAEISLETTPHAITLQKAKAWLATGINRLSIGVESFQDEELKAIGRDHSAEQACTGITTAVEAGFSNINIDLMYGLPTQTLASLLRSLEKLAALHQKYKHIKHISAYGLQLADHSPLWIKYPRGSSLHPDDLDFSDMYALLVANLSKIGFAQYEISNFSQPGFQSRHNLNYWNNVEYLAFGVGAHRYVDGVRSANWRSLKKYMAEPLGLETEEPIDDSVRVQEGIMLGLRLKEGINFLDFQLTHGVDLQSKFAQQIAKLQKGEFLEVSKTHLRLTAKAFPVSNLVIGEFF